MRVLHVGSLRSQHAQIAALTYKALGYDAVFLNTSKAFAPFHVPGVPHANTVVSPWGEARVVSKRSELLAANLLASLRYLNLSPPDHKLLAAVRAIAESKPWDMIVSCWGLSALDATLAAQMILPDKAHVHHILTFPEADVPQKGVNGLIWALYAKLFYPLKHAAYYRLLHNSDVRIHATSVMLTHIRKTFSLGEVGKDIVLPTAFPEQFFPRRRLTKLSRIDGEPHVIHIGATNFSGGTLDDLSMQFARLAEHKIHIHYSASNSMNAPSAGLERFYHRYDRFPMDPINGSLAEYMTQFDMSLMLYNVDRVYKRFENSLPDRFLYSLITGIPIGVPAGLFPATESYITQHQIGASYDSESALYTLLKDPACLRQLEVNAQAHAQSRSLSANLAAYEEMFRDALLIRLERNNTTAKH